MMATLPAVQADCRHMSRYACISAIGRRWEKRIANRRHRRYLNRAVNRMIGDVDCWWEESFSAPSLSSWELW